MTARVLAVLLLLASASGSGSRAQSSADFAICGPGNVAIGGKCIPLTSIIKDQGSTIRNPLETAKCPDGYEVVARLRGGTYWAACAKDVIDAK